MTAPFLNLPLDILTDSLLPLLHSVDLVSLSATCQSLHTLITGPGGEAVWRAKARKDYNFPTHSTGRRTGWMELYKRLEGRSCFVWGENMNGRLGLGLSPSSPKLIGRAIPVPTRLPLPQPVISLSAGGYSFHALTTTGSLLVWGTLDGEDMLTRGAALTHPGVALERPMVLPASASGALGHVVQVEAGRKHVVLRNEEGRVWEYRSWGRAYEVQDADRAWGGEQDKVIHVEAGWEHSLVLTAKGQVYVWWQLGPGQLGRLAQAAGEGDVKDPMKEGVTFQASVPTLRLPALPVPKQQQLDKITSIASGDYFVLALTERAKVYYLDISPVPDPAQPGGRVGSTDPEDSPGRSSESRERLDNAFISGQRKWQLMSRFCDIEDISRLLGFAGEHATLAPPPANLRITHISAHFHSFSVYSVPTTSDPKGSVVLLGNDDWNPMAFPEVVPELQGKAVIKIVDGDYHKVALTSFGQLFSWGSYSNGALGLGHPSLPNTPLYDSSETAQATAQQQRPLPTPTAPTSILPPPPPMQALPRPRPFMNQTAPPPAKVEHPTLVRFRNEADLSHLGPTEKRDVGKFVFDVTAAGWHTGALAVELGESDAAEEEEPEASEEELHRREFESHTTAAGGAGRGIAPVFRGGLRPFRIGFAGRGIHRAGFGQPRPEDANQ